MPLPNRVTPFGDLVADPARGLVYGNRGCLHDPEGRIRRRYAGRRWIACRLEFRGWRRSPLLQPGRFTELFFLDEATAFAAGHRPCALCRREDYGRFVGLWERLHPGQSGRRRRRRAAPQRAGRRGDARAAPPRRAVRAASRRTFVARDGVAWLALGPELLRWTPAGYTERHVRPAGGVACVLTPPSLLHVLRSGWDGVVPLLHPSAYDRVPGT